PEVLMPGTAMPPFFKGVNQLDELMKKAEGAKAFGGISGVGDVRKNPHAQIELLRDFLMTFGAGAEQTAGGGARGQKPGKKKAEGSTPLKGKRAEASSPLVQ